MQCRRDSIMRAPPLSNDRAFRSTRAEKVRKVALRSRQHSKRFGVGAVSSVGERFLDTEEVVSSILTPPTIKGLINEGLFRLRGLGGGSRSYDSQTDYLHITPCRSASDSRVDYTVNHFVEIKNNVGISQTRLAVQSGLSPATVARLDSHPSAKISSLTPKKEKRAGKSSARRTQGVCKV